MTHTKKTVVARDLSTLKDLIKDAIEREGPACDLNHIDVSNIWEMNDLFAGGNFCGDISKWNVSNVLTMKRMFECSAFNGNLSDWNTKNLCFAERMFDDSAFQGDLSSWTLDVIIPNLVPSTFRGTMPRLLHFYHCAEGYAAMIVGNDSFGLYLREAPLQGVHSDILIALEKRPDWIAIEDYDFFKMHQRIGESVGLSEAHLRAYMLSTYINYKTRTVIAVPVLSVNNLVFDDAI